MATHSSHESRRASPAPQRLQHLGEWSPHLTLPLADIGDTEWPSQSSARELTLMVQIRESQRAD